MAAFDINKYKKSVFMRALIGTRGADLYPGNCRNGDKMQISVSFPNANYNSPNHKQVKVLKKMVELYNDHLAHKHSTKG